MVLFSHIMPFIESPDEPDGYFNLAAGPRRHLLDMAKGGRVSKWFCGHYHRNAGGWDGDDLEVVITAAVGANLTTDASGDVRGLTGMAGLTLDDSVSGLRVVQVHESAITHKFIPLCELCGSS